MSRLSLESEPDLVAFTSSSILPPSNYSFAPPPAGHSPALSIRGDSPVNPTVLNDQRVQAGRGDASLTDKAVPQSPGNRSRARASSLGFRLPPQNNDAHEARNGAILPTYSNQTTLAEEDEHEDHHEDSDDDEDLNDLEMDTLNKNSQGRGGWKMLPGNQPSTPTTPRLSSSGSVLDMGHFNKQAGHRSRFEPLHWTEWLAIITSTCLVSLLTVVALHMIFEKEEKLST
ncbi:hypothetical protein EMMF5_003875 [Cystobasidiomycetes sp. EMM_F5]